MSSRKHHCRNPLCQTILDAWGYCDACRPAETKAETRTELERKSQASRWTCDPTIRRFYSSPVWVATSKHLRAKHPLCQRCNDAWSTSVHHVAPLRTPEGWRRRLDRRNLIAVCESCHAELENVAEAIHKVAKKTLDLTQQFPLIRL